VFRVQDVNNFTAHKSNASVDTAVGTMAILQDTAVGTVAILQVTAVGTVTRLQDTAVGTD
jgi:hypothetical protein